MEAHSDNSKNDEIIEVIFRKDRFYVKIQNVEGSQETLPRASYVWLKHNPSFKNIPKGYVVHHLDHDKTNDDPSNLVIMHKLQHIAYHFKQVPINTTVVFDDGKSEVYEPSKRPRYHYRKDSKRYFVAWYENKKTRRLYSRNGKPILTEEEAKQFCDEIWERAQKYRLSQE
ncbi:MAG TPA: HNH endonuclease signature motif containing protein [Smithellaceae bacterium]|nr:HNH endonuclease signature motif containing protein [Smithellaceae bacterium]